MHRPRQLLALLALLALAPFALAACGGGDEPSADVPAEEPAEAGAESTAEEPDAATVKVKMGEWWFDIDETSVPAGEITFEVENVGAVEHEFLVLQTDLPVDQLPTRGNEVDVEAAGELLLGDPHTHGDDGDGVKDEEKGAENDHATGAGEPVATLVHSTDGDDDSRKDRGDGDRDGADAFEDTHIDAGESDSYTVELEPGSYVLLCNLPGHYEAGQQLVLEVTP